MEYDIVKYFGKEFEAIIKRISTHQGVLGVIVTNNFSEPVYSTMDNNKTYLFSQKMAEMGMIARSVVRQIDPEDDLEVIRIKTSKYEVMTATPTTDNCIIAVQQTITDENK